MTFDADGGEGGGGCCCLPVIAACCCCCCDDTLSIGTASTPVKHPSLRLPILPSKMTTVGSTKSTTSNSISSNVSIGECFCCRYLPCDQNAARVLCRFDLDVRRGTTSFRRLSVVLVDDDVIIDGDDDDAVIVMVVFCVFCRFVVCLLACLCLCLCFAGKNFVFHSEHNSSSKQAS